MHNFHKSGQRAIATSINGPDKGHNTYRSVGRGGGGGGGGGGGANGAKAAFQI